MAKALIEKNTKIVCASSSDDHAYDYEGKCPYDDLFEVVSMPKAPTVGDYQTWDGAKLTATSIAKVDEITAWIAANADRLI